MPPLLYYQIMPRALLITILLVATVLILFVPARQQMILSEGIDNFASHRPLYAGQRLSQVLTSQGKILGVGAIVVDLHRAEQLVDVEVQVVEIMNNEVVAAATIPSTAIHDDRFAYALFDSPLKTTQQKIRIEFTAPEATANTALGLRLDPQTTAPSSSRVENGQEKPGTFAVAVIEQVPLWRYLANSALLYPAKWLTSISVVAIVIALALLSLKIGWRSRPPAVRRAVEIGIILCLAALAFNHRMHIIPQFKGVSGGDPYNYLLITRSITKLENPFQAKRLPGYPLLLVPTYLSQSIDDHTAMRTISAVSAAGSLIMLALLARTLQLPWSVQLVSAALLAWQKDFFWTSLRPEPYTLYTFLLLTSLWLFFRANKPRQQILFSLALGYAAMTRHEGFVLAIILFTASMIKLVWPAIKRGRFTETLNWNLEIKNLLAMYLPALLIVLPFFVHNALRYGSPLFTPYWHSERLQIVDSWPAFQEALGATWGVLGSMWKQAWTILERVSINKLLFAAAAVATILWSLLPNLNITSYRPKVIGAGVLIISLLALVAILVSSVTSSVQFNATLLVITAAIILISPLPFVIIGRAKGALVLLIAISQIAVATWFHPFPKHYQQSYPLIILVITTVWLVPLWQLVRRRQRLTLLPAAWLVVATAAILLPLAHTEVRLFQQINAAIDNANEKTAADAVGYWAVLSARQLPGPYAIDQLNLPAQLYLENSLEVYPYSDQADSQQERRWLSDQGINVLIDTSLSPVFASPANAWQPVASFKSEGSGEVLLKSSVYIVSER
jgi:hypothetical protein